jgi:2-dehydro-3-deoxyphosphogluconate aldolase/(4S)-4-hydroxy-2-oxoglutarate aldolase
MSDRPATDHFLRPALPDAVIDGRIIAVLRSSDPVQIDAVVDVLVDEGFRAIELALTTPNAVEHLSGLRRRVGSDVSLGAGTVTTPSHAASAIDAGAAFLLAPTVALDACAYATARGVPFVSGAFTPTEALAAWEAGAAAIKLFPANLLGPDAIPALRAPMPEIQFIPTGGINTRQAIQWLSHGCTAVGVGSPLVGDALEGGDLTALRNRSRDWLEQVSTAAYESAGRSSGAP